MNFSGYPSLSRLSRCSTLLLCLYRGFNIIFNGYVGNSIAKTHIDEQVGLAILYLRDSDSEQACPFIRRRSHLNICDSLQRMSSVIEGAVYEFNEADYFNLRLEHQNEIVQIVFWIRCVQKYKNVLKSLNGVLLEMLEKYHEY